MAYGPPATDEYCVALVEHVGSVVRSALPSPVTKPLYPNVSGGFRRSVRLGLVVGRDGQGRLVDGDARRVPAAVVVRVTGVLGDGRAAADRHVGAVTAVRHVE